MYQHRKTRCCSKRPAARALHIPTLCAHEAVSRSGSCRLCVVEIKKGNRTRIVTSCLYRRGRRTNCQYKKRAGIECAPSGAGTAPGALPEIGSSAKSGQGTGRRSSATVFADTDKGKCILCRSCVRVCEEVVGVSAIGLSARGSHKTVGTPFKETSIGLHRLRCLCLRLPYRTH